MDAGGRIRAGAEAPMKWPVFLGSDASNVTAIKGVMAIKGITTLTEQEEGGADMCTKSRCDILHKLKTPV